MAGATVGSHEELVRSLYEPLFDVAQNRPSASAFCGIKASVSRTAVTPYDQLLEILRGARAGRSPVLATCKVFVKDIEDVCAGKLNVSVHEDPIDGNPAHAEIVATSLKDGELKQLTRGMSNDLLKLCSKRSAVHIL